MSKIDIDKLLDFEKKFNLKDKEIYGVKIWNCRRTRTLNDIIETANNQQNMCDKERIKKIKFFSRKNFITKKDYNQDILLVTDARRIKVDGKYESIYTDEIENILSEKYKCLTLEEPSWTSYTNISNSHHYDCTTKNIKYVDIYELIAIVKRRLFKIFCPIKNIKIKNYIDELIKNINIFFDIDVSYIRNDYVDHVIYFYLMKKTYSKIIDRLNPKCVCFYYRDFPFKTLFLTILKEKNIPTIEMQHGFFTEDEPIEKKGDCNEKWDNIPDYLFAFGKSNYFDKNLIYKSNQIRYIGNMFLEKRKNKVDKNFKIKDYEYILVISQSTMGDYISKITSELSEKLSDKKYKIIFKYHPNESGREYDILKKKNIIEVKDNSEEIYKYQKKSIVQIGVSSTAIFEGLCFELPTIILNNPERFVGVEKLLKDFSKGIYFAKNADDIVEILKEGLEKPLEKDVSKLWVKNSFENFEREILKIINERG